MKTRATLSYCDRFHRKIRVVLSVSYEYNPETRKTYREKRHYFDSILDANLFLELNYPTIPVDDSTGDKI